MLASVYDGFQNVAAVVDMVCGALIDMKGKGEDWTKEAGEKLDESDDDWRFDGMTIPAGTFINAGMRAHLDKLVGEKKLMKVSAKESNAFEQQDLGGDHAGKTVSHIKTEMQKDSAYERAFDQAKDDTLEWFKCFGHGVGAASVPGLSIAGVALAASVPGDKKTSK